MKFALALIASVLADSPDCPESTEVFSYSERVPAAAGFIQLTACQKSGIPGISCIPVDDSMVQFATGMNGDEDLGQDIIMKGEPFHYQQTGSRAQFATGMNGDEDLGQDIIMKGEPYHYNQKSLAQFATGMNGDEDLGQDIIMKGEPFHYQQTGSRAQFATGMNGDEDLGQDIIMKGEPFHYAQRH
jgi:hypothetical protein